MIIEHREQQLKVLSMPLTSHVHMYVLLQIQFELHDNNEMMKSAVLVVELGMPSIAQLQASPRLSQSQMCCSQSMCLPCELQPWAAARHSAVLVDMMVASWHAESSNFKKDAHFAMHAQAHAHCNMHTNACTDAHKCMHRCTCRDTNGTSHWETHWNMNIIICFSLALFSSTPLALLFSWFII